MRHLAILLFLLISPLAANAEEDKKDNDCKCVKECLDDCKNCDECRDCRIKKNLEKRKRLAAEEAKRRKIRLYLRKGKPNIIVIIRPPVADRGNGIVHHHHHHYLDRWRSGYPRYRRLYRGIYRTSPPSYRTYRDRTSRVEQRRPRVWYDGLRTRTD